MTRGERDSDVLTALKDGKTEVPAPESSGAVGAPQLKNYYN